MIYEVFCIYFYNKILKREHNLQKEHVEILFYMLDRYDDVFKIPGEC